MTTVPPPLERRRIGTSSARQASTCTSSQDPSRRPQDDRESRRFPEPQDCARSSLVSLDEQGLVEGEVLLDALEREIQQGDRVQRSRSLVQRLSPSAAMTSTLRPGRSFRLDARRQNSSSTRNTV